MIQTPTRVFYDSYWKLEGAFDIHGTVEIKRLLENQSN